MIDAPRHPLPARARLTTVHLRDGWPVRTLELDPEAAPRGTLLFVGGRGDFIEKYAETFTAWAHAGWRVRSFDWRGQGLSGRLGSDATTGHAEDFTPWVGDLAELCGRWQGKGEPFAVIGHSMGGHLVLRALVERAIAPDAVVLVVPMIGTRGPPAAIGSWVAAGLARLGAPDRPAWASNEKPGHIVGGRQSLLTHDDARYADELWWRRHRPDLVVGPPSWSWLAAAYRSSLDSFTRSRLAAVTTPILILNALADRLVDPAATVGAAQRLPNATLIDYGDASAHEILREVDVVRDHALERIDRFLEAHAAR